MLLPVLLITVLHVLKTKIVQKFVINVISDWLLQPINSHVLQLLVHLQTANYALNHSSLYQPGSVLASSANKDISSILTSNVLSIPQLSIPLHVMSTAAFIVIIKINVLSVS